MGECTEDTNMFFAGKKVLGMSVNMVKCASKSKSLFICNEEIRAYSTRNRNNAVIAHYIPGTLKRSLPSEDPLACFIISKKLKM